MRCGRVIASRESRSTRTERKRGQSTEEINLREKRKNKKKGSDAFELIQAVSKGSSAKVQSPDLGGNVV